MFSIDQAVAERLIFHRISTDEANIRYNTTESDITHEEENTLIKNIFLKPFQHAGATWEFRTDGERNVLHALAKELSRDGNFVTGSVNIGKHLKSVSVHPAIKDGDLFVIKFADVLWEGNLCEALGIYKVENKEAFLENTFQDDGGRLSFRKGISGRKHDKACLILFTAEPFTVFSLDSAPADTEYWKNDFLNVQLKKDPVNNTSKLLTLTKSFITESLPEQFEIEKADQIDLLNRSARYFKNKETFTLNDFEEEVLQDPQVIDAFQSYDKGDLFDVNRGFDISQQAVKRQARIFKSVLKLDRNFHIYIHGNRELIERGEDEDGRKFYKLYYKEES